MAVAPGVLTKGGDQEWDDLGVGQGEAAEVSGDRSQLRGPVVVEGVDGEFVQDEFGHAVQQCGLLLRIPVERHRVTAQGATQATHRHAFDTILIDDFQRGPQDPVAVQGNGIGDVFTCGFGHPSDLPSSGCPFTSRTR